MPLLAQLVVEYAADLSDLEAGTQRALDLMSQFGSEAASSADVLEGVFTEVADEAEALSTAVSAAGEAAASASSGMEEASQATNTLATSFRDRALAAADEFSAKVEQLAAPITSFASNLTDRAGSALSDFGSHLQQAAQPVVEFGQRIGSGISETVSTLQSRFNEAKSSVTSFVSNISSSAGEVVSRVASPFEEAGTIIAGFGIKASESVSNAVDAIRSRFSSVAAPVTEFGSRIMEALPSLSSFGRGVSEAASALPGLISRVGEGAGALARFGMSAIESGTELVSGFGEKLASIGPNLLEFGSKIGMTVLGIQGLIQGAQQLGSAILSPNASMEQTTTAFTQLLGSSQAAQKEIKSLSQMAADTPFEFPDLANSEQQLIAFQIPLKDTHPLLMAIGDALSGLGKNTPAQLDQVVSVFGQMNAAGKLQTQDLMQLTSVGINGFQILATQMGKPVSVIKDMVTNGTIPASQGIELLRQGMEKTFGGGMQAQATTFNGLLSTFQDNIGAAWRSFTGPLFDKAKQGLTDLGNLVSSKSFQDFATGAGKQVGQVLNNIGTFVSTNVVPAFQRLWPWVENLLGAFKSPEFHAMADAFKQLGNTISTELMPVLQPMIDKFTSFFTNPDVKSGADGLKGAFLGIRDAVNTVNNIVAGIPAAWGQVQAFLAFIGGFLIATFKPTWDQLADTFKTQVVPAWHQLEAAIEPALPQLQLLGEIIGGILVLDLGFWLSVLSGIITGIAKMVPGLLQAFGGLVTFVQGVVQFVQGIVMFIYDLVTGNFGRLSADLGMIWAGIVHIFSGAFNLIMGIVNAGTGFIIGFVSGFIASVIGFFTHLYDELVGHSIVPDMINSIINWFLGLPGRAVAAVASIVGLIVGIFNMLYAAALMRIENFVNGVVNTARTLPGRAGDAIGGIVNSVSGVLSRLPGMAAQWMTDFGNSIVNGINNFIGQVGQAAGNIANAISSHLHFSLPEEGPLAVSDKWMPDLGNMLASGLNDQVSNIRAAALNVASAIAGASGTANIGISGTASFAGGANVSRAPQVVYVNVQPSESNVYLDREKVGKSVTNWQKDVSLAGRRTR